VSDCPCVCVCVCVCLSRVNRSERQVSPSAKLVDNNRKQASKCGVNGGSTDLCVTGLEPQHCSERHVGLVHTPSA
jgi:hypothetical protein